MTSVRVRPPTVARWHVIERSTTRSALVAPNGMLSRARLDRRRPHPARDDPDDSAAKQPAAGHLIASDPTRGATAPRSIGRLAGRTPPAITTVVSDNIADDRASANRAFA